MSDFDQVIYCPFMSMSPCFNLVLKTFEKKKNWLQTIPSWNVARAGMKCKPITLAVWDFLW